VQNEFWTEHNGYGHSVGFDTDWKSPVHIMLLITPKVVKSYREGPKKGTRGKQDKSLILETLAEYVNGYENEEARSSKTYGSKHINKTGSPADSWSQISFIASILTTNLFDNMKSSIILMAAAVQQALTAAIAIAEPGKLVERANWYDTCYSASLLSGTTILQAYCYNAAGSPHYTQLELNNCFNNNNGQIYVSNRVLNPSSTSKGMNSSAVLASDLAAAIAKCSLSSNGG
jgi:hypothetical protein